MSFLPDQELGNLCLSFATLLHSGMDLSYGVNLISSPSEQAKPVIEAVRKGAMDGLPLSDSLPADLCPPYMTGLVRVGEESGRLEQSLYALSGYYFEKHARAVRIRSALTYPIVLSVLMLAVIGILLVQILPVFDRVYASLGGGMTGAAGILLQAGIGLKAVLPVLCAAAAVILASALAAFFVRPIRARAIAAWNARFGDRGIARRLNDAKFAQAMSMGLAAGMALDQAVELAGKLNRDVPGAKARYDTCAGYVRDGSSVTDALRKSCSLPADACALLELGQSSGTLDQLMEGIASRMLDEANQAIDAASARVEPALVIAASLATGLILIAVMLPLLDIMSAMG